MTTTTGIEYGLAAVFLIVIIALVVLLLRRTRNVYGKLWAPLVPLVGGTSQGSRLSGTYDGMPLTARISGNDGAPVSAHIAGDGGDNPHFHYELTLAPGMTGGDWALSYTGEKFLGTGTKTWRVKSKDDALRDRLTEAGAATAMREWPGQPEITYKSKTGTLHYWQPVAGMYAVPSADEFRAQLVLLSGLAEINQEAARALPAVPDV